MADRDQDLSAGDDRLSRRALVRRLSLASAASVAGIPLLQRAASADPLPRLEPRRFRLIPPVADEIQLTEADIVSRRYVDSRLENASRGLLADVGNVSGNAPQDGDILVYDPAAGEWVARPQFVPITATGGTVTDVTIGGVLYRIHTFTNVGTSSFAVTNAGSEGIVDVLIVAGGGAGGSSAGGNNRGAAGGGGAGGFVEGSLPVSEQNYSVVVGAGAPRTTSNPSQGANGGDSSVFGLTAIGGGGGGIGNDSGASGSNGGSGGGGGNDGNGTNAGSALQPGSSSDGFGSDGGAVNGSSGDVGAGGGGAGGLGGSVSTSSTTGGGDGGPGRPSSITGTATTYAGGGGGGSNYAGNASGTGGTGGSGGGGNGGNDNASGSDATGYGSGGGGAGDDNSDGGAGSSGIVIIRYPLVSLRPLW